jgi:acetyltransferase
MTIRNLDFLFAPKSITLISGDRNITTLLIRNLLNGGFAGPIMPVVGDTSSLAGVLTYPDVESLPITPELAVIASPLSQVPGLIEKLGQRGTRAAILVGTAAHAPAKADRARLKQAILDAAKPFLLRILGPACMGVMVPARGMNAGLTHLPPTGGNVAFVTHSGGVARAALEWAAARGIGFSHLISLGAGIDVDFGDLLDYLAANSSARAILLHLERIRDARKFMSAARRTARIKPVMVLKPRLLGQRCNHDAVYEAAFRRAGLLRVRDIDELFNSVETLAVTSPITSDRLAIVGNSRSMGLLASDTLHNLGGQLAEFGEETCAGLRGLLDPMAYLCNPVDLGDHAGPEAYGQALDLVLAERGVDGVVAIHAPSVLADANQVAEAVAARKARRGTVLVASWLAPKTGERAEQTLAAAGIPSYQDPGEAVRAFVRLVEYRRNQRLLMEAPSSIPEDFLPDSAAARRILAEALAAGRDWLSEHQAIALLRAYQIPVVETRFCSNTDEVSHAARDLGGDVAVKLISPDVVRKSNVGGVALEVESPEAAEAAAQAMLQRLHRHAPDARHDGFVVQPMARREGAFEVTMGIRPGGNFGPVIEFGHGGLETEVIQDLAYGLPPLNMNLAHELMSRTRIYRALGESGTRSADLDALALTLIKISQMVIELPELSELHLNPLWASSNRVLALDAKVRAVEASKSTSRRLAIRPYPKELEEAVVLADGRQLLLRPISPEDEVELRAMSRRMPPNFMRMRFFQPLKELTHEMAAPLTQIDYDREMALVLADPGKPGAARLWGVVRMMADPDNERAEYAIIISPELAGQGIGNAMMTHIIEYARKRGVSELWGEVLRENDSMLRLNRKLGFQVRAVPDDPGVLHVTLAL